MKKYLRSMTKVASRVLPWEPTEARNNAQVAQHREKAKAYRKHWTPHRSRTVHAETFGLS